MTLKLPELRQKLHTDKAHFDRFLFVANWFYQLVGWPLRKKLSEPRLK